MLKIIKLYPVMYKKLKSLNILKIKKLIKFINLVASLDGVLIVENLLIIIVELIEFLFAHFIVKIKV
jgi:hypothetical protein